MRPESMTGDFGVTALNPEILYLACIIGWFCAVASAFAALSTFWIYRDKIEGYYISAILGIFWIGIGLHLGFGFARPQHLGLDAAKGAVILILSVLCYRKSSATSPRGPIS